MHAWNIIAAISWFLFLSERIGHVNDKRHHGVPATFVLAGIVSMGLALLMYEGYLAFLNTDIGDNRWLYHILVVGVVEEGAKFIVFLFALAAGGAIKEPQDGVIYGAIVGMTFGAVENIFYIEAYRSVFMFVRPVLTTGGHAIYGAIWGGMYSQAVYANAVGRDPGARRNSAIGVPLVALMHGVYNALTGVLPLAILVDLVGLFVAVMLYRSLVELSPYRIYPLEQARRAVASIRRGLTFNPKSPLLNRNLGLYLMHLGKYRSASERLRASVPRSRDPRRAQFLAACCEFTFLPNYYARRALRIAWARLGDSQRASYMRQLRELVGETDDLVKRVNEFTQSGFKPRKLKSTREIAREHKVRRIERRHARANDAAMRAIEGMTAEEKEALARRLRGG